MTDLIGGIFTFDPLEERAEWEPPNLEPKAAELAVVPANVAGHVYQLYGALEVAERQQGPLM
jgi:hypothetical protein